MTNPFKNIIVKQRAIVVKEEDVTKVITTINHCRRFRRNIIVQRCGWEKSNKWFLQFKMSNHQWENFCARVWCSTEMDKDHIETFTKGNFRP